MAEYTERARQSHGVEWLNDNAQVLSITLFFALCVGFFTWQSETFLTSGNLLNIVRQSAPVLIVAVAMTFVIMTAGIDLSVGSIVALVNALAAILMANGFDWVSTSLMMLVAGALVGLAQGWFISFQGIAAFIVTLAGRSSRSAPTSRRHAGSACRRAGSCARSICCPGWPVHWRGC